MRKIIISILIIHISVWSFGQQNYGAHEYGKTVYNLFSLDHKAVSYKLEDPSILTPQDLYPKNNKEDIVVYIVYEISSDFKNSTAMSTKPITKLMDFYIVYDYSYRINYSAKDELARKIPKIELADGSILSKITIKNHFINEKGKLEDKQLKKSAFEIEKTKGLISIKIDENALIDSSLIDIHAKVISRNFYKLQPSVSDIEGFDKHLIVSFPAIFNYKIPELNNYELSSHSNSSFELLNFINSLEKNGEIEKINTVSQIYTWKIDLQSTTNLKPEFELNGINFIPNADIGIKETDILNLE
jgi:hypothetical protein